MEKKISSVDYLILMRERRKKRKIFHVKLLKKWESPCIESIAAYVEVEVEEDDFPELMERQC